MALPSSGAITLSDVNTNIGASSTANITMNNTAVRLLANGDTTTNPVTMNSLYGKSWVWTTNVSLSGSSTFSNYSTTTDSSGNVYTAAVGTGLTNNIIIKTNPVGTVQWITSLNSTSGTYRTPQGLNNSLAVDSSGNVYYACRITQAASPFRDYFGVAKLNSSGVVQWSSFLISGSNYSPNCTVGVDSSGNVYVCTFSDASSGASTAIIAKYNSSGTLQWQKSVNGLGTNQDSGGITVDPTNDYVYLNGWIYTNFTESGAYVGKFDTNLSPVWERLFFATSGTSPRFYGCAVNSSTQNVHCMIGSPLLGAALFNSSGTLQWQNFQNGANNFWTYIAADSSGNTYLCGKTGNSAVSSITKYSSSGSYTAGVDVTSVGISGVYAGPITVNGSFLYSVQDTITSSAPINGGSIIKIPTSLSVSGTYGRVSFSSVTYTPTASTYSVTSTSRTIANSVFSTLTNVVGSTDVTSSYTRTVYPI